VISRSIIYEKTQDLLSLETIAAKSYKETLEYPESAKYKDALTKMMNDELRHFKLVKRILELI